MDTSVIESLYRQLLDAWNQRDANGFASLFAEDGNIDVLKEAGCEKWFVDKFTAPVFTTRPTLFLTPHVYALQRFRLYSAILASTEQGQEAAPLDESSYTKESLYAMGRCYCRFFRLRR
jgi:hypothetical protein